MNTITKTIPLSTKVYASLAQCCRFQQIVPSGVQPVFDAATKEPVGFAKLPEKESGFYIFWIK